MRYLSITKGGCLGHMHSCRYKPALDTTFKFRDAAPCYTLFHHVTFVVQETAAVKKSKNLYLQSITVALHGWEIHR